MAGPFAVAQMILSKEIRTRTGQLFPDSLKLFLADTLADPYVEETHLGALYEPIAKSRREANRIKREEPIFVCLGNPPYDLHESERDKGGWVVTGHEGQAPIWEDFLEAIRGTRAMGDVKPIYNLYAYFWRWALWKVFEANPESATGIVGFITASSFLMGPGWGGVRSHMREIADEIWVLDLGGEGHGARKDENVFDIRTPVAITLVAKYPSSRATRGSAKVNYWRIPADTRAEKFRILSTLRTIDDVSWQEASSDPTDPFVPLRGDVWKQLPSLLDIFPWHAPGIGQNRNWVRSPDAEELRER